MFNNFYKNKRILITGHTGFKGSWLTLWLLQLGADLAGFSSYLPSDPCNFKLLELEKCIRHVEGDVRILNDLKQVFDDFLPEVVFHLAAQPIVRKSYNDPKLTFDTNVGGTVNILECIRRTESVKSAVIITSDKCYKNVEWIWGYRENDTLGGEDPYSASKASAEMVINSYCKSFFVKETKVNVASARAGNVIGGGDWAEDRIIPDCVRAWSKNEKVIIRNPGSTRPWQHVLEPLSGYLWLGALLGANYQIGGDTFNFGPKEEVIQPVYSLIAMFQSYWKKAKWEVRDSNLFQKESRLLKLCCDKAMSLLNWKAILSFEECVKLTALWYSKFYEGEEDMRNLSQSQIEWYSQMAIKKSMDWTKSKSSRETK